MKRRRWLLDTIAGWFSINIVIAIVVCVALNALVLQVAGIWGQPSLTESGILQQAASIARMVDAAPAETRPALIEAASRAFRVTAYAERAQVPLPLEYGGADPISAALGAMLGWPEAKVESFDPAVDDPHGRSGQSHYVLAMQLRDRSWLTLDTPVRSWGMPPWARFAIVTAFVLLSSFLVATIASRRLALPIRRFAAAAERFGADVQAPPLQPLGPVEFRDAIEAFNAMQARIQRFVADRTQMLAAISHDLRAPLTRMVLRIEFSDDREQQKKLLRDVDEMQSMVNAALQFFSADSQEEVPTRFDLAELINTVLDDCKDAGGEVSYTGLAHFAYDARPVALKRAIANLVDNAVKYGHCANAELIVGADRIEILLRDRGPGIPAELREAVFRPFFRAEGSRNRATGGFGLGLGTARSIVRGHGGELTLERGSFGGNCARISLPVMAATQGAARCDATPTARRGAPWS